MANLTKVSAICLVLATLTGGCAVYAPPVGVEIGVPVRPYYGRPYYDAPYYGPRLYAPRRHWHPYYYGPSFRGYYRRW